MAKKTPRPLTIFRSCPPQRWSVTSPNLSNLPRKPVPIIGHPELRDLVTTLQALV